jgi:hypothetical protein
MTFRVGSYVFFAVMAWPPTRMLWRDARHGLRGLWQKRPRHVGVRDRGFSSVAVLVVVDQSYLSITGSAIIDMTT